MKEGYSIDNVSVLRDSGKAILVKMDGDEEWIPHSAIHDNSEVYEEDQTGTLVVKLWFANKRGWL